MNLLWGNNMKKTNGDIPLAYEVQVALKQVWMRLFDELSQTSLPQYKYSDVVSMPVGMREVYGDALRVFQQHDSEYFDNDPLCVFSSELILEFNRLAKQLDERVNSVFIHYEGMYILLVTLSALVLRELERGGMAMTSDDWHCCRLNIQLLEKFVEDSREEILSVIHVMDSSDMVSIDVSSVIPIKPVLQ